MPTVRDVVLAYLRAIEARDHAAVRALLHPELELVEHPNKLNPAGARYDLAAVMAAAARGAAALASERYDVRAMVCEGDRAAVQTTWTGTLPDGRTMTAAICSVIELRDGRVWRQEQYDCFAP